MEGPALLSTWILTITMRTALDVKKKAQLRLVPLEDELQLKSAQRTDEGVRQHQAEQSVEAVLATLPDGQRAVLVLAVFEGCSHKEIATMLQLDVGTVKSRLSRARAALRTQLQESRNVG
ncbi:MAG: RNA polymerase sigma factor [Deltaproteobacteria bacterium]|nr:RNA polymerase sigma factor [Deltaproteobacteria bacterium]